MYEYLPSFDNLVSFLAALQVGILLAMSVGILFYYSRHRAMGHIALVAISYILLTTLVAGAMIFRVFYEGTPRTVGMVMALIAFITGDYSLWKVWHNRRTVQDYRISKDLEDRIKNNDSRLTTLEARLSTMPGIDEPLEVRIVDGEK